MQHQLFDTSNLKPSPFLGAWYKAIWLHVVMVSLLVARNIYLFCMTMVCPFILMRWFYQTWFVTSCTANCSTEFLYHNGEMMAWSMAALCRSEYPKNVDLLALRIFLSPLFSLTIGKTEFISSSRDKKPHWVGKEGWMPIELLTPATKLI